MKGPSAYRRRSRITCIIFEMQTKGYLLVLSDELRCQLGSCQRPIDWLSVRMTRRGAETKSSFIKNYTPAQHTHSANLSTYRLSQLFKNISCWQKALVKKAYPIYININIGLQSLSLSLPFSECTVLYYFLFLSSNFWCRYIYLRILSFALLNIKFLSKNIINLSKIILFM